MRPHHERAIQKLRKLYEPDPRYLALIIVGSVAAGSECETSDVDHILVATDEEFAQKEETEAIHYCSSDFCDYPEGYVEGKIVNRRFIEEAAARGSEPARSQFLKAKIVFSKIPNLKEVVEQIAKYPEEERERKIRSFYAQMEVLRGYFKYGEQKADQYIMMRAASGIVLFGGRLILTHNRILYPYHKWFMRELGKAAEKPPGFTALLDAFLKHPTTITSDAFCSSIVDFMRLQKHELGFISRFVMETEWDWLHGGGSVEDW